MEPGTASRAAAKNAAALKIDILRHIEFTLGRDPQTPDQYACFMGLAYSIRDRLVERWIISQRNLHETMSKRVYFLSLEFLPGRFLMNYLLNLNLVDEARSALQELGFDLDELEEVEWDAGLGNGGLGRLASCYMDSIAHLRLPGYGYGIRYDYGIFHQVIENGYQKEECDNWGRSGNAWEIRRREQLMPVHFYGRSDSFIDHSGRLRFRWVDGETVLALACDILVPGRGAEYVTNMRLWAALPSRGFNFQEFSQGDYVGAVEAKVLSENISKVLYPSDEIASGRELRLKQQYFFVAATLQDIIRRYKRQNSSFANFANSVAIQLNDTHPSIAIPELMRILMDEEGMEWDEAWSICENTFSYTNHTLLPEALETWPSDLLGRLLPRHLEIIYEINRRFLEVVRTSHPDEPELELELSLIQEGFIRRIRMAHLAIVGSHAVNGVAELHTAILKRGIFKNFARIFPDRLQNVTNGITPRRWLLQANPRLAQLITSAIGPDWKEDLNQLKKLVSCADDAGFRLEWMKIRQENKRRLARYVLRKTGIGINPDTLFDVHIKRIHEYKRQLLNALHLITLYNRIKSDSAKSFTSRTVLFSGKAAPAYHQAKRIIKLINSVAEVVNKDPDIKGRLRAVFLPNYCVSQAEKIIPAADLSEQISTAGMEASGTGNMKMALNGALTIGTMDGANVEILEAVGRENIFIFGLNAEEVAALRAGSYNPRRYYEEDPDLHAALNMIGSGFFSPEDPRLFAPILRSLLDQGDYYMLLADYRSYITAQEEAGRVFQNPDDWARRSILNTANMGRFSSDRAVLEYAGKIWNVQPV
ncbi:MAG: glycogen/starch/alpha-glucan phosphorylase [Acidobacteria bacterium]|nr:glycogen/starch/alpha-glucan phosphorylase [Acidobacteriota bacterium]